MFTIALAWWVVSQDGLPDRELTLGLLLAATTLPIAAAGFVVGPLIDRFSRRACMAVADIARLLLMAGLAVLLHRHSLTVPVLFALCIPLFFFEPLFHAAVSASIGSLAKDHRMLSQLVAIEQAIPNAAAVLGTLLATTALAASTVEVAFWLNTVTFLVSLLLVSGLPPLRPERDGSPQTHAARGFGFLRHYPGACRLLALFTLTSFLIAPVFFYLPLLARDVLGGNGAQLGLLELGFALGNLLVFGLFIVRPTHFPKARYLRFGLVVIAGLLLGVLATLNTLWAMLAVLTAWGAAVGFVTYLAISSFQHSIPNEFKGRFFALLTSLCTFGFPLSLACTGWLSAHIALQHLIVANAACILLLSPVFLSLRE